MKKIFVIDDDPFVTDIIQKILSEDSFKVRIFNSAKDALSLMTEEKPDLLIVDIVMPKLDGFELLKLARTIDNKVKTIIMSGGFNHIEESDIYEISKKANANGWIIKPFTVDSLLNTVEQVFLNN